MMENIQIIIADQQYADALSNQNATIRPYQPFPEPTEEEYDAFLAEKKFGLLDILDSPIGVFQFKEFAKKHPNYPEIIDFLVQYERIECLDAPDLDSARTLIHIGLRLPDIYKKEVENCKKAFRAAFGPLMSPEISRGNKFLHARVESLRLEDDFDPKKDSFPTDSRGYDMFPDPKSMRESNEESNFQFSGLGSTIRGDPFGSILNPFGRSSIAFGGFKKEKKKAKPEARDSVLNANIIDEAARNNLPKIASSDRRNMHAAEESDTEEVAQEEPDFYDRSHAMNMQELQKKQELKEQCLAVFSELAQKLKAKAEYLFELFSKDSKEFQEMVNLMWYANQPVQVKDFILFRDLGRGAFGVVSSAKTKTTGTLTAIKCMNKKLIKGKKAKRIVGVEKSILEVLGDNPSNFTIWLKYSFQDADFFYMAIPLCTGGDLAFHLKRRHCYPEEEARFYFAEIMEGLSHLHKLEIIYRDLKPENVIFDAEGHVRISDMGLAIQTEGRKIRSKAGTPGYWAPEVINRQPYSYSADYWSLGCVLYEMLTGLCPFSTTNSRMERDKATLHWKIKFPKRVGRRDKPESQMPFPEVAVPVILGLLDRNRSSRFDEHDVRRQEWFKGMDWFKLRNKQLEVPWSPKKGQIYAANPFDLENQSNENAYRKEKLLPEDEIEDFDYVSKYSHELDIVQVLETRALGKLAYDQRSEPSCCCFM